MGVRGEGAPCTWNCTKTSCTLTPVIKAFDMVRARLRAWPTLISFIIITPATRAVTLYFCRKYLHFWTADAFCSVGVNVSWHSPHQAMSWWWFSPSDIISAALSKLHYALQTACSVNVLLRYESYEWKLIMSREGIIQLGDIPVYTRTRILEQFHDIFSNTGIQK